MKNGLKIRPNDSKDVVDALKQAGAAVVFANRNLGCALAFVNTGKCVERKIHQFTTANPITSKGVLSHAATKELEAAGLLAPMSSGAGSSTKRLIARGAAAAVFSGAILLSGGAGNAMAQEFGFNYFGGTNPLAEVMENGAKPAFVDIDKDGDLDCFVGNSAGYIDFLKNDGTSSLPSFSLITGDANPLTGTGGFSMASPAFVDIDGDGDMDCFVGTHDSGYYANWKSKSQGDFSAVSFFENMGTPQSPVFNVSNEVLTGTQQTIPSNPLVVGGIYAASPAFVDIDGDGDMDAFIGERYGSVLFYENVTGEDEPDKAVITPTISFVSRGYLQDTGSNNVQAYYANYSAPTFSDIDGDGDFDLTLGSSYGDIQYFENVGTAQEYSFEEKTGSQNPFGVNPGPYSAPVFADINGDGLDDLFAGASPSLQQIPIFSYILDLVGEDQFFSDLASNRAVRYYQNTGTKTEPAFRSRGDNPFNLGPRKSIAIPAFGDIDGDGDLDALVGGTMASDYEGSRGKGTQTKGSLESTGSRYLDYYENTGTLQNPVFALHAMGETAISWTANLVLPSPAIADLDGDGINEVYVGYSHASTEDKAFEGKDSKLAGISEIEALQYVPATKTLDRLYQNPLGDIELPNYPSPSFVDIDGDGDLDVFISGFDTSSFEGVVYFYRNDGTAITPTLTVVTDTILFDSITTTVNYTIAPSGDETITDTASITATETITGTVGSFMPTLSFADLDGDGDQDAVMGDRFPWYGKLTMLLKKGPKKQEAGVVPLEEVEWKDARYFKNIGNAKNPVFEEQTGNANLFAFATEKTFPGAVVLADLDSDKDVDAVIGDSSGKLHYYRNVTSVEEAMNILDDDDDLCFVQTAQSDSSLWERLTGSCKQGVQKIRNFFSPS